MSGNISFSNFGLDTLPTTASQAAPAISAEFQNIADNAATPAPTGGLSAPPSTAAAGDPGMRAILSALHPEDVYAGSNPGILAPLAASGGMIFPYSPAINFAQSVSYMDLQLVHSNYDFAAYTRTPTCTLTVSGKFTVQNQTEGLYALAAIHFLRTASKSYFGEKDAKIGKAGLPPPVLLFSAYGKYMYNKLRVILKNHSWNYEETMDTIVVKAANGSVRLPALFTIQVELMVVQTPQRVRTEFSFDEFAAGGLLEQGGWI